MNLIKFDPYTRHGSLSNFFDGFFNNAVGDFTGSDYVLSHPAVNITETEDAFSIELAAPGLEKNDFNISVERGLLTISAGKETQEASTDGAFRRREFNYSTFRRTFRLPKSVEQEQINATYENGILQLALPKKAEVVERARSREIAVS